jgi:hypothetical protein
VIEEKVMKERIIEVVGVIILGVVLGVMFALGV